MRARLVDICVRDGDYHAVRLRCCCGLMHVTMLNPSLSVPQLFRSIKQVAVKRGAPLEVWNLLSGLIGKAGGYDSKIQKMLVRVLCCWVCPSPSPRKPSLQQRPTTTEQVRTLWTDPEHVPLLLLMGHHATRSKYHHLASGAYFQAMRAWSCRLLLHRAMLQCCTNVDVWARAGVLPDHPLVTLCLAISYLAAGRLPHAKTDTYTQNEKYFKGLAFLNQYVA